MRFERLRRFISWLRRSVQTGGSPTQDVPGHRSPSGVIRDSLVDPLAKIYPGTDVRHTTVGRHTYISPGCRISLCDIGAFCSIGPELIAGWGIHPVETVSTHPMFYSTRKQSGTTLSARDKFVERKRIHIGNDVFIGARVTILDGVSIGDGAVIGAGSVVTKDVPAFAVVVGVPARIARMRFSSDIIQGLITIAWWDWPEDKLRQVEQHIDNPEEFIALFGNRGS